MSTDPQHLTTTTGEVGTLQEQDTLPAVWDGLAGTVRVTLWVTWRGRPPS
jgi:hypothetical protein